LQRLTRMKLAEVIVDVKRRGSHGPDRVG